MIKLLILLYLTLMRHPIFKPKRIGDISYGTGIGLMSSVCFILLTDTQFAIEKLLISLICAIMLIVLGTDIIDKD